MTSITFSQTALPPLVRVSSTVDAPFAVSAGTSPNPVGVTVRVIGVHEVQHDTRMLAEPQVRMTVKRGRQVKEQKRQPRRKR